MKRGVHKTLPAQDVVHPDQHAARPTVPPYIETLEPGLLPLWHPLRLSRLKTPLLLRRSLPEDELVILSDSSDVIWLPCGRDLAEDFKLLKADVVLSRCDFNYPDLFKEQLFPDLDIQDPATPFESEQERLSYQANQFINAGVIMGRAGALLYYMGGRFIRDGYIDNDELDDQR